MRGKNKMAFNRKFDLDRQTEAALLIQARFRSHLLTRKHLVLFFDINGTVMAADSVHNKDLDTGILQFMAENISAKWREDTDKMTYKNFVETHLHPGSQLDLKLKKKRFARYKNFLQFLAETHHPLLDETQSQFEKIKTNLSQGVVFNSFIDLIHYLRTNHIRFTLIFRTFGNDFNVVLDEVKQKTKLQFQKNAAFKAGQLYISNGQVLNKPADMLSSIKPFAHTGWQDDWEHWHAHSETFQAGKPYPIDLANENVVSIFFDDKALEREIIGLKSCREDQQDEKTRQQQLIACGRLVPVNTMDAVLNRNYFIDHVKFALKTPLNIPSKHVDVEKEASASACLKM
jgi:hypothetical protein